MDGYRRRSRLCTMSFAWWTAKGLSCSTQKSLVVPALGIWIERFTGCEFVISKLINVPENEVLGIHHFHNIPQ